MDVDLSNEGALVASPIEVDQDSFDHPKCDGADRAAPWWRQRWSLLAIASAAVATIVSVVFRLLTPMWVILYAADDDQLYVRLGHSLIGGEWLGVYDRRTLEKPAGFSMFLAMAHLIPLPFLLVVHLFHLAVAALFAYTLARVTSKRTLGFVVYVVLALDPSYYSNGASRVVRDNWYSSMCLLLFTLAVFAIPKIPRARFQRSARRRMAALFGVGLAAGIVLAGYWLARVERPWMLPPIGALLLGGFLMRRRNVFSTPDGSSPRLRAYARAALPIVGPCLIAIGVLAGSLSFVSWKNERAYGVSIIDDFYTGQFARMYGDWQGVNAGPERRYISISHEQREAVYRISPAARELAAYMESPDSIWLGFGCQATGVCDDIVAGWLLFGLRDATFAAGEFDNAPEAQHFWSHVADDIEGACTVGRLSCRRPIPFALPDPSRIHVGPWFDSSLHAFRFLLDMKGADTRRPLSGNPSTPQDAENWTLFRETVRGLPSSLDAQRGDEKDSASWMKSLLLFRDSYRRVLVVAFPLSIAGYLLALWRRRSKWSRVFLVGVSAGVAVAARVVLLGFVGSTSFPATDAPTYILPASAFLLVFVVCGTHLLVNALRPWRAAPDRVSVTAADEQAVIASSPLDGPSRGDVGPRLD